MKHDRMIAAIAIVTIAVILIGEVIVYTTGTDDFNVNVNLSGKNAEFDISVRGSQVYSVVAMDNGSMKSMDEVYVYYDESYASAYVVEPGPIGSHELMQEYYVDQMTKHLVNRGTSVRILSAADLAVAMNDDISGVLQKGLIVASGALPDTIYTGDTADLIFDWLNDGGRLFWVGNLLGKFIATPTGIVDVTSDYQMLFFGVSDCLNASDDYLALEDVTDNNLRYDLSLRNNDIRYAVNTSKLTTAGVSCLATGFTDGTYDSIVLTEYGNGMVCVFGGDLSREQYRDVAQIVSSGVCYNTSVLDVVSGSIRYGSDSGSIDLSAAADNVVVYVYLGGYFPVYGRSFSFSMV